MPHLQVFKSKERVGEWGAKRERERDEGDMEGGRKGGADKERKQEKEERNIFLKNCAVWD